MRQAYEAEATATGKARLLLTAAVGAGKTTVDAGYEVEKIAKYVRSWAPHSIYQSRGNNNTRGHVLLTCHQQGRKKILTQLTYFPAHSFCKCTFAPATDYYINFEALTNYNVVSKCLSFEMYVSVYNEN